MREPLIVQAGPSPLAKAFVDLSSQLSSGPTPEQRAYYQAQSQKAQFEAEELQRQSGAMKNVDKSMAALFAPQPNPEAVGPFMPGTAPEETPDQRGQRMTTGMASLFAGIGKDNAAALQSGLATGEAYGGVDNMRRSMVLQGKSIDEDFSPTAGEGNRVATRNADNTIRVNAAKPDTSVTPRNYITPDGQKGYTLDGRSDGANGAPIPQGSQIFTGQVNAETSDGFTQAVKTGVQNRTMSLDQFDSLANIYEQAVDLAPESAFGATGQVIKFGKDMAGQAAAVTSLLSNLGYQIDPNSQAPAVSQAYEQTIAKLMTEKDISPETVNTLMAAGNSGDELAQLHTVMLYTGAATLAGQDSRGTTDRDIKIISSAIPNPRDMLSNKAKIKTSIGGLRRLSSTMRGSMPPGTASPGAAPIAPAPAPAGGGSPITTNNAGGQDAVISKARQAIAAGKSREHVIQRLRQNGIEPPPDL